MADRPSALKTKFAVFAALIPLFVAIAAYARGSAPQPFHPKSTQSAIAFRQYLVDKGLVDLSVQEIARFDFVNNSGRSAVITKIKGSCGCLTPVVMLGAQDFRPDENGVLELSIPPGARGTILIQIQMANQEAGDKDYTITVETADRETHVSNLTYSLKIPDRGLEIQPRELMFISHGGPIVEKDILVIDHRESPYRVLGAKCKLDFVDLKIGKPHYDEHGYQQTPITVTTPNGVPPGKHTAFIQIYTDDAEHPVENVALWISQKTPTATPIAGEESAERE